MSKATIARHSAWDLFDAEKKSDGWKSDVKKAQSLNDVRAIEQNLGLLKNDVPPAKARKWESIAAKEGLSLSEWIIRQLP